MDKHAKITKEIDEAKGKVEELDDQLNTARLEYNKALNKMQEYLGRPERFDVD